MSCKFRGGTKEGPGEAQKNSDSADSGPPTPRKKKLNLPLRLKRNLRYGLRGFREMDIERVIDLAHLRNRYEISRCREG